MAQQDAKRRGTTIPTGYIIPVTASYTGTSTAAFTGCLPCVPPCEVYKIKGFDVQWWTSSTCTEQNSIEVGMCAILTSRNIETTTIRNGTGGAWAVSACSSIGSSAGIAYTVRARPKVSSDAQRAPYNTLMARSGTIAVISPSSTTSASAAGTAYTTSTAYDFKLGAGGDTFSLNTADVRVKTGTRLGYVPAVRITNANKTDCFQQVNFTVYFEAVSPIGNPQP